MKDERECTSEDGGLRAPLVDVIEVAVEHGFAVSDVTVGGWGDGGSLGDYDVE